MSLAVRFSEYGSPAEVLTVTEVPDPSPGPGQVRVRVKAAGVNPFDWKLLSGMFRDFIRLDLPAGLGADLAGVVEQAGEGVTAFAPGDEVLGPGATPAYAQVALARAASLVRKPADVPWEVAGALPNAGATAWSALKGLRPAPGETLLVHAAAGGVGFIAAQLGVAWGAKVIGTAGDANRELLESVGVTPVPYGEVLEVHVRGMAPDGVDAVLDASTREGVLAPSVRLAGGPERVTTLGFSDEAKELGVRIHDGGSMNDVPGALTDLIRLIADGKLRVPISGTFPLAEAARALETSRGGHVAGKLVLLPEQG